MALIKCPECGKDISNKAPQCIHCGYPLQEIAVENDAKNNNPTNLCVINGISYDLTDLKDYALNTERKQAVPPFTKAWEVAQKIPGMTGNGVIHLMAEIEKTGVVPKVFIADKYVLRKPVDDGLIHCPRCDSTNVVTGQRGYSMMWGFIGSNRTMNRCAKCGHKWEPKK